MTKEELIYVLEAKSKIDDLIESYINRRNGLRNRHVVHWDYDKNKNVIIVETSERRTDGVYDVYTREIPFYKLEGIYCCRKMSS